MFTAIQENGEFDNPGRIVCIRGPAGEVAWLDAVDVADQAHFKHQTGEFWVLREIVSGECAASAKAFRSRFARRVKLAASIYHRGRIGKRMMVRSVLAMIGVGLLADDVHQGLAAVADGGGSALEGGGELGGLVDTFAMAVVGFDDLLVSGGGAEFGEQAGVGLCGGGGGIHVKGGAADGAVQGVVVNDDQDGEVLVLGDEVAGGGVGEHVGAVAQDGDHLAVGRGEFDSECGAEAPTEASGGGRAEEAAGGGERAVFLAERGTR